MATFNSFNFNCGAGLSWFSAIVSNAVTRIQQLIKQITVNPHRSHPQHWMVGLDILEWDDGYTGFAYGRYLTFTNNSNTIYPFWLGIYFEHSEIRFGIWFDTTSPARQASEQNLQNYYPQQTCPGTKGNQRGIYVWMDINTNDNMFDGSFSPIQCEDAIYNFINDVLSRL